MPGCSKTPQKDAVVTFQFDDAYLTQYMLAKPLFDSKGIKASIMVPLINVDKPDFYMTWTQLLQMFNEGWEIGSHSVNHPDLRSADEATIRYELAQSKTEMEARGIQKVKNFTYPYSYYDADVLNIIPEYYRSARTSVAQTGFHVNPEHIQPYELSAYEARLTVGNLADAYKYVDRAKKEGRWLIFILHEFIDNHQTQKGLTKEITDIKAMEMLIDYIQAKNIRIMTTDQALDYYIGREK